MTTDARNQLIHDIDALRGLNVGVGVQMSDRAVKLVREALRRSTILGTPVCPFIQVWPSSCGSVSLTMDYGDYDRELLITDVTPLFDLDTHILFYKECK